MNCKIWSYPIISTTIVVVYISYSAANKCKHQSMCSSVISNLNVTKRNNRLESKKRKIKAFLALVDNNMKQETQVESSENNGFSSGTEEKGLVNGNSTEQEKKKLSEDELKALRMALKARQKAAMQMPKLYLTTEPLTEGDQHDSCQNLLLMSDIQHLLLFALQGGTSSYIPRWCKLLRQEKLTHIVVAIVCGVSTNDFKADPNSFPFLATFPMDVEVLPPVAYGQSVMSELFWVPLSNRLLLRLRRSQQSHLGSDKGSSNPAKRPRLSAPDPVISRVDLLMTHHQLVRDGYPLPHLPSAKTKDYIFTSNSYKPVTNKSPLFAIDCEMCETTAQRSELTRVSVINENRECIYTTLVKPRNQITNYLTRFSGITRKMLKHVKTRIEDVQRRIQELLPPDAILIGHSLNFDLHALQMMHPYVIDTSVIYNNTDNPGHKLSLKRLTGEVLHRVIQANNDNGHDPTEDALAALDLVLHQLGDAVWSADESILTVNSDQLPAETVDEAVVKVNSGPVESSNTPGLAGSHLDLAIKADAFLCPENGIVRENAGIGSRRSSSSVNAQLTVSDTAPSASAAISDSGRFIHRRPNSACESFFSVVKKVSKTAAVSGFTESELSDVPKDLVTLIEADCDKQAVKRCCQDEIRQNFLICAKLMDIEKKKTSLNFCLGDHSQTGLEMSEHIQRMYRKTDKRLKKLTSAMEPGTLVIVLLTGTLSSDVNNVQNSKCLLKIT